MTPHRAHLLEMRASRPGATTPAPTCPICHGPAPAAYLCAACCASYDRAMARGYTDVAAMTWAADRAMATARALGVES